MGTEEQWVQRTRGMVDIEDQWNSGYRGQGEQWAERTSGTLSRENQWNSGYRGTVGTED